MNSGPDIRVRELGIRLTARRECDELQWNRWSEWDVYPDSDIARTIGIAKATRDPKYGPADAPENTRPTWSWSLDQTALGTNDFRSIKFNIRNASLLSEAGEGIEIHGQADAHVRACLAPDGVLLHVLSRCTLAPTTVKKRDHLTGQYSVSLKMR